MRRRQKDLDEVMPTWFDDVSTKFPGFTCETKKGKIYLCHMETDEDGNEYKVREKMGYTCFIEGVQSVKSVAMPEVDTIFYDEFLPDNNVYLRQDQPFFEPECLMSLYMSVARGYKQPIRPNVKIVCIANHISVFNRYFTYFGVNLASQDSFKQNGVFAEKWFNEEIASRMLETDVGKFLATTKYGQHAIFNQSLKDIQSNICKPPHVTTPLYELYFQEWYTAFGDEYGNIYFKKSYDETLPWKYKVIDTDGMDSIPWFRGNIVKATQKTADNGMVFYADMSVKSVLGGMFQPKIIG